jgi:hypothetical protein
MEVFFIERARRWTGRPSQAQATGCGDLKRDKIWAQIRRGIFDFTLTNKL